ncbi:MAG: cation:proton antiporter, partial [Acetobacteraceae bacterium]|nr:cation:proton antiporter [Acetobacteraceae bacterium]
LRPPHRVTVILEGESMFNDATALLVYRVAVAGALGQAPGWADAPQLVLAIVGGAALGAALAWLYPRLARLVLEGPGAIVAQFIGTFAIWILADRLGLSPIITIVTYAIVLARIVPAHSEPAMRVQSYAVWDVVVFVMNVLAFITTGLQLRPILSALGNADWRGYAGFAAAVLGTVIVVRIAWMMSVNGLIQLKNRRIGPGPHQPAVLPTAATGLVISWAGMRGVVTLATALALPDSFPQRPLLLFAAFVVVLGTLVLQGLTLPALIRHLRMPSDDTVESEVRLARARTAESGLAALRTAEAPYAEALRRELAIRRGDPSGPLADHISARLAVHRAERNTLVALRARREIGDDAFHAVEQEIDFAEMFVLRRLGLVLGSGDPPGL